MLLWCQMNDRDLKLSWTYDSPWIPSENKLTRLMRLIHHLSYKFRCHDWFHRNTWCIRFGALIIMECELFTTLKAEITKEINLQITEQLLGINNLAPKEPEALTVEKLEHEWDTHAKRLGNIHGSGWAKGFNFSGIYE